MKQLPHVTCLHEGACEMHLFIHLTWLIQTSSERAHGTCLHACALAYEVRVYVVCIYMCVYIYTYTCVYVYIHIHNAPMYTFDMTDSDMRWDMTYSEVFIHKTWLLQTYSEDMTDSDVFWRLYACYEDEDVFITWHMARVFMHVPWLLRAWHNSFRHIDAFVCVWMKQVPRVTRLREDTREIHLFLGETCRIQSE